MDKGEELYLAGVECREQGDSEGAVKNFIAASRLKHREAYDALAFCYLYGEGIEQNAKHAFHWYSQAANHAYTPSQSALAYLYYNGEGVAQNYAEAAKWAEKAAKYGDKDAQYLLGCCYEEGQGVEINKRQAKQLFEAAAQQGHVGAQEKLKETVGGYIWEECRVEDDDNALRRRVNEVCQTTNSKYVNVCGRQIYVQAKYMNAIFLNRMVAKFLPVCLEDHRQRYKKAFFLTSAQLKLESFKSDLPNVFTPVYKEIERLLQECGISTRGLRVYQGDYYLAPYYEVLEEYNAAVREYNEAVDLDNHDRRNGRTSYRRWHVKNPESFYDAKETIERLELCVKESLRNVVYSVGNIINKELGEPHFPGYYEREEVENEYLDYFKAHFDVSECGSEEAKEVLLNALQETPNNKSVYEYLMIHQAYEGCGLTELINLIYPGGAMAREVKWGLIADWMRRRQYFPSSAGYEFVKILDGYCQRMEIRREDALPAFILRTWIYNLYQMGEIVTHPLLGRINDQAYDENDARISDDHPTLIARLREAHENIRGERQTDRTQYFEDAILRVGVELLPVLEEDSQTVLGKRCATYEEAEQIRKETADFLKFYHNIDFSAPGCVAEVQQAVDAHIHRELLWPFPEKARRAAELDGQIEEFMQSIEGKTWPNRCSLSYDVTRGWVLEQERFLLGMGRLDLRLWCSRQTAVLNNVFGEAMRFVEDANDRYYNVMEKAWVYHNHLAEKDDPSRGFFGKIATAVTGLVKGRHENEYLLATDNGNCELLPLIPDERQLTASYWTYKFTEADKLDKAYRERYDPLAVALAEQMRKARGTFNSCANAKTLDEVAQILSRVSF
jgi:hypothetical protein